MTPRDRYACNLGALQTLVALRDRLPFAADLATLSLYEGWADGRVRAFGYDSVGTPKPELRECLAPLGIAPDSLITVGGLSAYFTPHLLARVVAELAVKVLGRRPVSILEPSAGTGAFLTAVDELQISPRPGVCLAIEPDLIFVEILRHRFPGWQIRPTTLERAGLTAPTFDLIISNAPFGDWGVADADAPADLRHRHLQSRVHDYFLCKAVSLLISGGVVALIAHHSTMDRAEPGVREWLSERAELVFMWRLPAGLWEAQGAGMLLDLIVMRKF